MKTEAGKLTKTVHKKQEDARKIMMAINSFNSNSIINLWEHAYTGAESFDYQPLGSIHVMHR